MSAPEPPMVKLSQLKTGSKISGGRIAADHR